ncbi:type VII secretion protein EccB [Streptomyces cavernicola]|uniref:Type VII secretion protein EccB n=1 Tax=Streptomyces cavernicola TaxID=3043613 RepID=A0ABT6SHH3_9ACTN|nr:type VII secretion protein EccB [Streptomyces sp. B-S-A6]MDI3407646.1 type VII secretion protein EccB [Streptomyces sp. B-S-A6]
MASRRDELNAYTFAKRRLIGQFLQPSASGTEEAWPRPLRAVVPGLIIAVVILAAFGAWGMFKPAAPMNWDKPGEHVIISSKSTTRYVVLKTDGKVQLHPVLNMSSAKLLLTPDKGKIINVDESTLDSGKIPHGPTLGIPYAPDRLPDAKEAGAKKRWAVCERPGEGGRAIEKAAFILAQRDMQRTEGPERLTGGELLYVQGPDRTRYVVDAKGTAYPVEDDEPLLRVMVGDRVTPQRVSSAWLDTLHRGDNITFPRLTGTPEADANAPGQLDAEANRVGMVLEATSGSRTQKYVVLPGRVAPVSDFTAKLVLNSAQVSGLGQAGRAKPVSAAAFTPGQPFGADKTWPQQEPNRVNSASNKESNRNTVCNVLRDVDDSGADQGTTTLSTWAGTAFPANLPTGSSSAYVTPGSGQLFRQFQGSTTTSGFTFLVTDTGLRYAMQSNGDSATDGAGIGESGSTKERKEQREARLAEAQQAQNRLGYENVTPAPVPAAWSAFLATGPRLSSGAALTPQGA